MLVGVVMNLFDAVLVALTIAAGFWGYANGGFKTVVKLLFIAAPSLALAYFGSSIASIGTTITAMLTDRVSAPLGLVGAGSGLLGMIGVVGSFFLSSRIVVSIMDLHTPGTTDRIFGSVVCIAGVFAMTLPLFIFGLKTFPQTTANSVRGSYAWPYVRPIVLLVHRPVDRFIDARMAGLVNGLSDNDFIARLALAATTDGSDVLGGIVDKVKRIDMDEIVDLQKAARALDPKQVEELLAAYKSGDMSRERLKSHLENPNFNALN